MTTTMGRLRGDVCPSWCTGSHDECRANKPGFDHPHDQGVYHRLEVATWRPVDGDDGRVHDASANVYIEAYRHDRADDWPDMVISEHVSPGWEGGVNLQAIDARRLGEALICAADLIEGA